MHHHRQVSAWRTSNVLDASLSHWYSALCTTLRHTLQFPLLIHLRFSLIGHKSSLHSNTQTRCAAPELVAHEGGPQGAWNKQEITR